MVLVFAGSDPFCKQLSGQATGIGPPSFKPFKQRFGYGVTIGMVNEGCYCDRITFQCILQNFSVRRCLGVEIEWQIITNCLSGKVLREAVVNEPLTTYMVSE